MIRFLSLLFLSALFAGICPAVFGLTQSAGGGTVFDISGNHSRSFSVQVVTRMQSGAKQFKIVINWGSDSNLADPYDGTCGIDLYRYNSSGSLEWNGNPHPDPVSLRIFASASGRRESGWYSCESNVAVGVPVTCGKISLSEYGPAKYLLAFFPPTNEETGDFPDIRWHGELNDLISDPVNPLTGEFIVHKKDMLVAAPLPIRFDRQYGSFNEAVADFGVGWTSFGDFIVPYSIPAYMGLDRELVRAMQPDGSVVEFARRGSRFYLAATHEQALSMEDAEYSSTSYIEKTDSVYCWTMADGTRRYYAPRPVLVNGNQVDLHCLNKVEDAQGNTVLYFREENSSRIDYGKVVSMRSSSGAWIHISRRAEDGLIEELYASDGRQVNYTYEDGYLKTVTTPDGTETYDYSYPGGDAAQKKVLVRIKQPNGRVLENNYNALCQVGKQFATVDPTRPNVLIQNASFHHRSEHTRVVDAYGRESTYEKSDGLLTAILEPLTRSTHREWHPKDIPPLTPDAYPRALKKVTDPRGLVTEYKYDLNGNVTETKVSGDLDGDPATPPIETRIVTAHFNSRNQPDWTADSSTGLTTEYLYEDTDYPYLATTIATKVTATGVVLRTDKFDYTERSAPAPAPATGTIFARGLLEKRTLALGSPDESVTDYDYDATGFRISEIRRSGTSDPDVSLTFAPTARQEIDKITDAAGRETTFTYDARSRPLTKTVKNETAATLAATATTYNAHGEVTRLDGPRSGPEDWIETDYDQAGRPSETRTWRVHAKADGTGVEAPPAGDLKSVTTYHHDLFGNLALIVDPKGHAATHQYDALGRLTHTRRFDSAHTAALLAQYQADQTARRAYDGSLPPGVAALSTESFTYEPGGQVETRTDVLGGTTTTLHNSRGQPRKRIAPDGSVTEWRYHADGRLAREILRNQTYWQIDYDDVARTVVRTLKKPDGTILATETRAYDRRGNLVSFTDAEAATFTTAYDDLDRVKAATGPAATPSSSASTLSYFYDAAGILTTAINALGEKTLVTRDALGRITLDEVREANDTPVRVTATAYAPDHHSATVTQGTGAGAVAATTYTDPQGRALLTRFADGTYSRQTYDLAGLPDQSRDPLDRATSTTFDALGHLATRTLPDAHLTTFAHNPAGQLLERRMASPQGTLVAKTVYDAAGRPTSSRLVNGPSETRLYSYIYHPATHPAWAGLPDQITDPRGVVKTFAYDDFLRVQTLATDGPAAETDSTTSYAYDRRGLLTQLVQTAPAAGPPTIVSRPRDAYGRVSTETVTLDGATLVQFDQHWNAAARRDRLTPGTPSPSSAYSSAPPAYTFQHRADGLLASVAAANFTGSYGYADNGLPLSRWNQWRTQTVTTRDTLGRPQVLATAHAAGPLQTETLAWRADHTLDSYSVLRSAPGAWDEARDYGYDSRGRVTAEEFSPAPGQTGTLASTFDHDGVGLGIRTGEKVATGAPAAWQSRVPAASAINAFARVTGDETNAAGKAIAANGISLGADYVELWINGSAKGRATHPGWADATGAWSASLPLDAGAQNLEVRAAHPSGHYTATAASAFTVSVPLVAATSAYDAEGNVTTRTFADGRVQTLTWDAFNRLVQVTERDAANHGYDWSAAYDGLGRRLRTVHQPIVSNAASGSATTILSLYDPAAEFLEIAVIVNGAVAWKVHGPDLDGAYGGWNGTGGLEAVLTPDPESATGGFKVRAAVSDAFGNVVATLDGLGPVQKTEWLATRVGAYGPLPNHRAELLASPLRLAESTAWRGRRLDPTGFYYLGARYYEPHTARFLSPDPYGHGSDMSLYAFANGDPVNRFDPDGRLARKRGAGEITLKDYAQLAGLIGWDGFTENLSEYQQNYYGSAALEMLLLELQGRDMSRQWRFIESEVPGVLPNWDERRMSLVLAAGLAEMAGKTGAMQNISSQMLTMMRNLAREAKDIQIVGSGPSISSLGNRGAITLGPGTPGNGMPPLQRIHPASTYATDAEAAASLKYWRTQPTERIVESLKPGNTESLRAWPDGRIFNGNTRTRVLEERGVPINNLPREVKITDPNTGATTWVTKP